MSGRGRCVTDVATLDAMIGGGIPEGSMVVISGPCGNGKSTLAYEFLLRGSLRDETGLLITSVEPTDKYLSNLPDFCFSDGADVIMRNFQELDDGINIDSRDVDEEALTRFCDRLASMIRENNVRRMVLDSFSATIYGIDDDVMAKELLLRISNVLWNTKCTGMLVSDSERFGRIETTVADGLIRMDRIERKGDFIRTMQVVKMKGTEHTLSKYAIEITDCGLLATRLLKGGSE